MHTNESSMHYKIKIKIEKPKPSINRAKEGQGSYEVRGANISGNEVTGGPEMKVTSYTSIRPHSSTNPWNCEEMCTFSY
jgi:hypothetical protein